MRNLCLWNCKGLHHRKLIESVDATVVDAGGRVLAGQRINFIGEWECCTTFVDNGRRGLFGRTHTPISTTFDPVVPCTNTDPYVFGHEFYWSCCKHPGDMKKVWPGDLVLFGSYTLKDRKVDKMVLDTVLVVDEVSPLTNDCMDRFTKCYNDVTLSKLTLDTKAYMVVGKMYDTDNEPFSFVPCRRDGLMDKLVLDVPVFEGKRLGFQQNGGHLVVDDAAAAFRQLVAMVREAGCELGVYMPEPNYNYADALVNKHGKRLTPQQKFPTCSGKKKKPTC